MRGFEIERTLDEDTCSMETLPEKILKVPGIALVAAGTPACLIGLYDSAARINSLDRLFLCQISSVEYSLGKQGKKIWEAVELAANTEGIRGVFRYSSCSTVHKRSPCIRKCNCSTEFTKRRRGHYHSFYFRFNNTCHCKKWFGSCVL